MEFSVISKLEARFVAVQDSSNISVIFCPLSFRGGKLGVQNLLRPRMGHPRRLILQSFSEMDLRFTEVKYTSNIV